MLELLTFLRLITHYIMVNNNICITIILHVNSRKVVQTLTLSFNNLYVLAHLILWVKVNSNIGGKRSDIKARHFMSFQLSCC